MKRVKTTDRTNYSYYLKLLKEQEPFQILDDNFILIAKHKQKWLKK